MDLSVLGETLRDFFSVNSVGSIAARAFIWFAVAIVIIASTDTSGSAEVGRTLRANLGLFMLFILLSGGLIYLLFGFVPIT
jgi:hypothetical protein